MPLLPGAQPASAQQDKVRPKIGLILKGGGALGIAHVGVIRVLERNHIPVDYIAGTSMGSIVGAAYASGVALPDMERTLIETDWDALFGEKIKRENVDYRLKAGRKREIFGDTKIGFHDDKFVMPQGVVEGQNIRLLFQRLFGNTATPLDFDSLPIPFRAVTADIETGEAYVPAKGDLPSVVRASMSIPGAFSPVEIDGRLLVDGGIVDNLPVNVGLSMGADVLIVVDLKSDVAKRKDLTTPLSITGQMVSLMLMQNSTLSRKLVRPHDVVIEPDVNGYLVTDFPKAEELMAIGEQAAESMVPELRKLSVSQAEFDRYSAKRTFRHQDPIQVQFIRIKNDSHVSNKRIEEGISVKVGDAFDPQTIEQDVQKIYQSGNFTAVNYSLVTEGSQHGIEIDAQGRDWLRQYVRLGFAVEDNFEGDNDFRLGAAFRTDHVTSKDSYFEGQFEIGKTPRFSLELYQPIAQDSPYFIAPKVSLGRSTLNLSDGNTVLAEYNRTEGLATLAVGRRISTIGEITIDYTRGYGDLSRHIGDPALPDRSYDIGDLTAAFDLDSLDRPDFPTSGYRISTRFLSAVESLGAPSDFEDLTNVVSVPFSFGRNTIILRNIFSTTFGERPIERYYSLGGFLNVSGTLQNSLSVSDYDSGSVIVFHRFSEVQNPFFDLAFFAGGSYELSSLNSSDPRLKDYNLLNSGSVFIGADTPIFPIYFGFGLASVGEHSFYITLGRLGQSGQ